MRLCFRVERGLIMTLPGDPAAFHGMLGAHRFARLHGFEFYNATVVRGARLSNTRLWLPSNSITNAQLPTPDVLTRLWILLNVTNTLHWNPLPDLDALNFDTQLVLTPLDLPAG